MNKVGEEVEVVCGQCKEERYHTVAALAPDGRIERVVCNFCHNEHKYHDPAGARKAPPRPRPRAIPKDEMDDPSLPAEPYAPTGRYGKGSVLLHPKYGRGRVVDVRGDRIDVRFGTGPTRIFVHAGPPASRAASP